MIVYFLSQTTFLIAVQGLTVFFVIRASEFCQIGTRIFIESDEIIIKSLPVNNDGKIESNKRINVTP